MLEFSTKESRPQTSKWQLMSELEENNCTRILHPLKNNFLKWKWNKDVFTWKKLKKLFTSRLTLKKY